MFLMRFTERAYTSYTEEAVRNSPNEAVRLTFSNSNIRRVTGKRRISLMSTRFSQFWKRPTKGQVPLIELTRTTQPNGATSLY